jgi:3-phenylpropionate/cinnamic acid dioxygenase small subunit
MDLDELLARQTIHDVEMRYLRGMDRQDWEAVRSCYHPNAIHDHGSWRGTIEDFIEHETGVYARFTVNTHLGANELIEVDGDEARCELYSVCWHRMAPTSDSPAADLIAGMRYFDVLQRREGQWRIADRKVVLDWQRTDPIGSAC